jgi:gamma-glutamyltranspeptidase/glutathione hydrolase
VIRCIVLLAGLFAGIGEAREAVVSRQFMVAAGHPLAVEAGHEVLKRGGSAVDAAVAVQMVLGLVEPQSSGIGGGAFLLHWSARERKIRSYDGRETAPAGVRADLFLREGRPMDFEQAAVGGRAVGVPGVLRMLELAHRRHGRLAWDALFADAIRLAEAGFAVSPRLRMSLERERFLREDAAAKPVFYAGADRIVNAEYGRTLRAVAAGGADAFYRGAIAADIVQAVRSHAVPGTLSLEDLADYRALEREPVCGPYREWRVCSMGPPSSGGIAVLQILGMLSRAGFGAAPPHSETAAHLFSEASRLAYEDRARYLGDPAFAMVPVARLLGAPYLDARAKRIGPRALRHAPPPAREAPGTSHFSIADAQGDVVSMTTTVESAFGSRVMVRGFLLNNQLTDFDFVPGSVNQAAPRKRPRSSMAPTIVVSREGEVRLALGSQGGPFIILHVAKTLVAALDWKLDIQAAIEAPNFGRRARTTLLERDSAYEPLLPALAARGHVIEVLPMNSGVQGIERVPGGWRGGADPRREGVAKGD